MALHHLRKGRRVPNMVSENEVEVGGVGPWYSKLPAED